MTEQEDPAGGVTLTEQEEIEEVSQSLLAEYRQICQLVKLEADKYIYVQNASIQHTLNQLPAKLLNMKANDFIDLCATDNQFDQQYNLEFKTFDEYNLLQLKKEPIVTEIKQDQTMNEEISQAEEEQLEQISNEDGGELCIVKEMGVGTDIV